ncbi:MAG TPA: hypothetical protein VFE54_00120 [Mucilaginibacter sp.]|jgi:hypothetical protein|nr:hypothetical protein [Mucilaginibacter sp.]
MSTRKLFIFLLFVSIFSTAYSQDKKVAVVTFYADKKIGMDEFGLGQASDLLKLENDPNFNLAPLLANFHTQFFDDYAKSFPFQLVPEADVTNFAAYKAYVPDGRPASETDRLYTAIDGYKVINYGWGLDNAKNLSKMFQQYDGVMFVFISFDFAKGFAIGGVGTVKVKAYANIVLYNKEGNKVFNIREGSTSKKTGVMAAGVPVMQPEKVLPMCESALTELMGDLQKKLPKIIKKADAKL